MANLAAYDQLKIALAEVQEQHCRLILLVGESGSGKTRVLHDLAGDLHILVINLSWNIAAKLLELTPKQRPLKVPQILDKVAGRANSPVILDNLEILFNRSLGLDPLRFLQNFGRNRPVVASWNGTFSGGQLVYATIGHPEHRSYERPEAMIVNMEISGGNSLITVDIP